LMFLPVQSQLLHNKGLQGQLLDSFRYRGRITLASPASRFG